MKKWIIIIASVTTVLIVSLVVCLGLLNKEPDIEVKTSEYFEQITWDTSVTDAKFKLSSAGYQGLSDTIYSKSNFSGLDDATVRVVISKGEDGQLDSFLLMFDSTSKKVGVSKAALVKLKKAYEKAFDKLTDKKVTRDIPGWDENIAWLTENSCIDLLYTKDKKLTITYLRRGTEYSDLIESLIEEK